MLNDERTLICVSVFRLPSHHLDTLTTILSPTQSSSACTHKNNQKNSENTQKNPESGEAGEANKAGSQTVQSQRTRGRRGGRGGRGRRYSGDKYSRLVLRKWSMVQQMIKVYVSTSRCRVDRTVARAETVGQHNKSLSS